MPPVDSAQPGTRNGREEAPEIANLESGEVDRVAPGSKNPRPRSAKYTQTTTREASPVLPAPDAADFTKQGVHLSL